MSDSRKPNPKYIYEYPTEKSHEFGHVYDPFNDNLTIGDLHGNPIKLIHILIDQGIIDFPTNLSLEEKKQQYLDMIDYYHEDLADYYNKDTKNYDIEDYYESSIKSFVLSLNSMEFSPNPPFIRLLGDILADRGYNDFFTILLLETMDDNDLPYEINISNHDEQFIRVFNGQINDPFSKNQFGPYKIKSGPATSLKNLGIFLSQMNIVEPEQSENFVEALIDIIDDVYLPKIKFINYEYDENTNTFSIFTHAPVGLITIELLAMELKLPYDDSNVKNLITTIETMNEKLIGLIKNGNLKKIIKEGSEIYDEAQKSSLNGREDDYKNFPMQNIKDKVIAYEKTPKSERSEEQKDFLYDHKKVAMFRMIWERASNKPGKSYDLTDMPKTKNNINFRFGHGHDTPITGAPTYEHIINFDSIRGKLPSTESEMKYYKAAIESQSDNENESLTPEDFLDHGESKGCNSQYWPAMKEINKDLSKMNQLIKYCNSDLFFQLPDPKTSPDPDKVKENIEKLPKKIANEYMAELNLLLPSYNLIASKTPKDINKFMSTVTPNKTSKK